MKLVFETTTSSIDGRILENYSWEQNEGALDIYAMRLGENDPRIIAGREACRKRDRPLASQIIEDLGG